MFWRMALIGGASGLGLVVLVCVATYVVNRLRQKKLEEKWKETLREEIVQEWTTMVLPVVPTATLQDELARRNKEGIFR